MSRRRTLRLVVGSVAALVAAGAVAGAAILPWPQVSSTGFGPGNAGPRVEVTPVAAETVLSCDGPLVALGRDSSDASALTGVGDLALTTLTGQGEQPGEGDAAELEGVGSAPTIVQAPDGSTPISVGASGSAMIEQPDLTGFVASSCRAPSPEAWIAGATVSTGVTDVLMITNPNDVAATVSLTVYGVDGEKVPAGGEFALSAHSQRAIPVASIAGEEQSPVVRVTAEGAPVRTSLQSSRVDTLEARGADLQAGTLPAREAVIPRVLVTGTAADTGEDPTQIRVLGTGGEAGRVEAEVVDEATGETVFTTSADLDADVPVTLGVEGLEAGSYAVRLTGDTPFVSAVRQPAGGDYAWLTPGEPLTGTSLVSAPETPLGTMALSFAATGGDDASVTVEPVAGGDAQSFDVAAGRSQTIVVDAAETYRVTVDGGSVAGAASVAQDDMIAAFTIDPDPAAPEPVEVAP